MSHFAVLKVLQFVLKLLQFCLFYSHPSEIMTTPPSPTKMDTTTPLEPPANKSLEKNPPKPIGFPDDVKEVWVYKRHVQTSGKQALMALAGDTCFIIKRNTVDKKMYLSGPPNYKKKLVESVEGSPQHAQEPSRWPLGLNT